eukprot:31105-Pelagococcus_subviridis.AAC.14
MIPRAAVHVRRLDDQTPSVHLAHLEFRGVSQHPRVHRRLIERRHEVVRRDEASRRASADREEDQARDAGDDPERERDAREDHTEEAPSGGPRDVADAHGDNLRVHAFAVPKVLAPQVRVARALAAPEHRRRVPPRITQLAE